MTPKSDLVSKLSLLNGRVSEQARPSAVSDTSVGYGILMCLESVQMVSIKRHNAVVIHSDP